MLLEHIALNNLRSLLNVQEATTAQEELHSPNAQKVISALDLRLNLIQHRREKVEDNVRQAIIALKEVTHQLLVHPALLILLSYRQSWQIVLLVLPVSTVKMLRQQRLQVIVRLDIIARMKIEVFPILLPECARLIKNATVVQPKLAVQQTVNINLIEARVHAYSAQLGSYVQIQDLLIATIIH